MTKTIRKPLACRNAHCGSMCSPAQAEASLMVFKEPRKCPNYERDDIGYEHEVINKIRAEIKQKLEQEEFARSVFRHEEKDYTKAEQCTGSIMAYRDVLKMFDKYKAESEDKE